MRVELHTATRRRRRSRRPRRRTSYAPRRRGTWGRRRTPAVVWVLPLLVLAGLVIAYAAFALLRSLPAAAVTAATRPGAFPGRLSNPGWPGQGEAAVGVDGVGVIASHGSNRPTPIASLAKVMTADVVLHAHPLHGRGGGPMITVTPADVAAYRADLAGGQSVVLVQAGERLSERAALEGLLLPSGNNLATLLAGWDAGSQRAFVAKMNATARSLRLSHTHYSDASGVQASTVSTAADQTRLAMDVMALPAFRQIVGMTSAVLPVAGRRDNLDGLLGTDGIIGIKTGTTSQAGGCFLFAATARAGRRRVTIVGAVLHQAATRAQPSILDAALHATTTLVSGARGVLATHRAVRRGATLAWISAPWTSRVALRTTRSVVLTGWPGLRIHTSVAGPARPATPVAAGARLAQAVITAARERTTVPLTAAAAVPGPSLSWRLTHP